MATAMVESKESKLTVDDKLTRIDEIGKACESYALSRSFHKAISVAKAMREMQELMQGEVLQHVLYLQGSPLGFVTDKDKDGGYQPAVVRDVVIEATLRGLSVVGNEFNILAGRMYPTKAGLTRLVRELPGLTDLKITDGRPEPANNGQGAYVPMVATWLLNGKADRLEVAIPVKVNNGMGADAILGKATRKMLARIYARVTGSNQSFEEDLDDTIEPIDAVAK